MYLKGHVIDYPSLLVFLTKCSKDRLTGGILPHRKFLPKNSFSMSRPSTGSVSAHTPYMLFVVLVSVREVEPYLCLT